LSGPTPFGQDEMSEEEARLIRRAKAGDPDAFAEIYDRYQPAVYRYIRRRG